MESNFHQTPYVLAYRRRLQSKVTKPSNFSAFKESIKTVSKEYCAESSICGLKHLVDDNTTCFERVIWMITMISALVCSISLVWSTFVRFYSAPLVTTQTPEGVSVSKIIFPAVGICTNNRISKRAVVELTKKLLQMERNKIYSEKEMLSLLLGLGLLYNPQPMNVKLVEHTKIHRALGEYDVNELMRNLTPKCEDLLMRCAWNAVPMNCSQLFDFRLTMNGYCCTFNYLRESDITFEDEDSAARSLDMYKYGNKSNFDFDEGLKVLMKLNESDDFYYNIPLQGAQLQFSDAYDFPDAPSGSFAMQIISPNVQMTVMVTATFTEASRDIQHVPAKLRRCLFYDESSYLPFYTHSDCLLKCRMLFLLSKCKCTPFNMPKMNNKRTCDMRDVPCIQMYNSQSTTVRPDIDPIPPELELDMVGGGIPCPMCYPSCSKTAYSYDFTNVKIYPEYLNNVPDSDNVDWLQGANFSGTSIVHVKYAREVADCYGQNVIMKWFDLISNIGSTCGFVTGFSFVSVLEFIYFFTVKLFREINNRRRQEIQIASETSTSDNFEPISRYRPIYWNELGGSSQWRQHELSCVVLSSVLCNTYQMNFNNSKIYFQIWWQGIKSLPETTSIHGFRFIADSKRHWLERIFWLIFVVLSWYGSLLLIVAQYRAFQNNPISFVVETVYKDWNTEFPSIAVCEHDNIARLGQVSDSLWGKVHDFNMEEVLKELAFFKGVTYYVAEFCGGEDSEEDCFKSNLSYYANLVRNKCPDIMTNCSWNGQIFDCCRYFRPVETELGKCFVINTIQGEKNAPRLEMYSNRTTGPGMIKFDVILPVKIYVLNEEDVPSLSYLGSDIMSVNLQSYHRRYITLKNIENDAAARMIAPEKRKCRYSDENILNVYPYYSYSACTVQCRKDAQMRLCNCTNFFMPNTPEADKCNISGIICLNDKVNILSVLKARWSSRSGLFCNCLPSCTEAEISIVKDFTKPNGHNHSTVQIELSILPSERYRRNVVRGILDLVVSTGGTGGLFLGASILSFVELFYILLLRPFFDIYSQRNEDPWHRKYGARNIQDSNFKKSNLKTTNLRRLKIKTLHKVK